MSAAAFDAWVEEARAVPLVGYALKRSPKLRRNGRDMVGPCPACGGDDRFTISLAKNLWYCRWAKLGGDVIALARYCEGLDFVAACESLLGRPAPGRDSADTPEARAERNRIAAERHAAAAQRAAHQAQSDQRFRTAERLRAWEIWCNATPPVGTPVEAYLALRGLTLPNGVALRYAAEHPLYVHRKQPDGRFKATVLHRGPAMIAGVTGADGKFAAVHQTWIDLSDRDGKARLVDPATGEMQPAKKIRGSVHGARIELVPHPAPETLFLGEGNETCLSAFQALERIASPLVREAALWAGVSLPNMAGRAIDRVPHPVSGRPVPGAIPDPQDVLIPIPPSVRRLYWLGDGDSDRFTTERAMLRAVARHHRDGLEQAIAWAAPGHDFNTMLRGAA